MALEINRLNFTNDVNTGIKNGDLSSVLTNLLAKRKAAILEVRKDLAPALRQQYNNLLVLYQAQHDVLRSLLNDDQKTLKADAQALWENELRISQTESGSLMAHCGKYSLPMFAHLPAKSIQVETELKRRMRLLFFEALCEKKAQCFFGPAGTGKTESIVDFCGEIGLGFQRVNCSDDMVWNDEWVSDQPNYGNNFVLIFDEFNRCDQKLQQTISDKVKVSGASFMVTCNPGYEGRVVINKDDIFGDGYVELETILPPYGDILRGMAACEGFVDCEDLGPKFAKTSQACRETLSKQYHYDFGLRSLKRVIEAAGSQIRAGKDETQALCEAFGHYLGMAATAEDLVQVQKLVKESFGTDLIFPENTTASDCINWWFKNTKSVRNINVVNCKDIDAVLSKVEWSQKHMVIDCDPKDFNEKFNAELQKAKDLGEKVLLVVKTQFCAATGEFLNAYADADNNHPTKKTVRLILFNNNLSQLSPAMMARIPTFYTK